MSKPNRSTRQEVYEAIDGERAYQDSRWNESTTTSGGLHSWEEWIIYIERYIGVMKEELSTKPQQEGDRIASDIMRKVAGMTVAALEQNGVLKRGEL